MYLKSIEIHGFKSFANKIVLEFHNGITGIVGPNGSGKSNIGDAVRWVLGEQSAKQLRGASMQDVIFAGTQNRKPLGYAYVAITMDNSDHTLPVDYQEVTVARRVYRSGESEYLLNGTNCRLRDVQELFYDTGVGKEGYSIIGQGQIERILSGKPEDRRELFDEAVGIVKFKKRKNATLKKLEEERENLVRVNDILSELEGRVAPLQRQSETARKYLNKREELKNLEIRMFLVDHASLSSRIDQLEENLQITQDAITEKNEQALLLKEQQEKLRQQIAQIDNEIEEIRSKQSEQSQSEGKLETEISILKEQIRSLENSRDVLLKRKEDLKDEYDRYVQDQKAQQEDYEKQVADLEELKEKHADLEETYRLLQQSLSESEAKAKEASERRFALVQKRSEIKVQEQRLAEKLEQINIRKAKLTQQLIAQQTQGGVLTEQLDQAQAEFEEIQKLYQKLEQENIRLTQESNKWRKERHEKNDELSALTNEYHRKNSQLESLRNIAERYDGYTNSIRRVMEQKASNPGILGVVSDLIHVQQSYEIAIETALGGSIQNIVTEDEATAKKMIAMLKENRAGRATFLPLTSVRSRGSVNPAILAEPGILGLGSDLVTYDPKYEGVVQYLLGRVIVARTIDDATALAKKNRYSLNIVTLDGEHLSPGGSLSGGRYKNSNNLLGRSRQIEQLASEVNKLIQKGKELRSRIEDVSTAFALIEDERKENNSRLQQTAIDLNTAKLNFERAQMSAKSASEVLASLQKENAEIEEEAQSVDNEKERISGILRDLKEQQEALREEIAKENDSNGGLVKDTEDALTALNNCVLQESGVAQKVEFAKEKLKRSIDEAERLQKNISDVDSQMEESFAQSEEKKKKISEIESALLLAKDSGNELGDTLHEKLAQRSEWNDRLSEGFETRDALTKDIASSEKEIIRLEQQQTKAKDALETAVNHMWDEYELTLHTVKEMNLPKVDDEAAVKRQIKAVREEIKGMGSVNVNAIEEYKEVSDRYTFLKTQHDDLAAAEESLVGIIEELDEGMRKQFSEGFADIKREFDIAFKELFGGGKGTLELMDEDDLLETGIRIEAQPPGKKLQNMMQLSGGEKSLTAIALLFAIQNLKPSPFCLLDEIEAALDDANVDRFAGYLHKLTKNTQFIVITHRRGSMNAADRLYGITMQEKGVSTLVSVNLIEQELDD